MENSNRLHQVLDPWISDTPDRIAAIDHDDRQYSFGALAEIIEATELSLTACGVRAGDRVMLVAENSVALISLIFACSRLNAWAVPVNARLTAPELKHIQQHARPAVMVFTHKASGQANHHAESFKAPLPGHNQWGEFRIVEDRDTTPEPVFESAAEQVAILIYTTGTMGIPKGVMVTHANSLHNIEANIEIRNLCQQDHIYPASPHTHIFGLTVTLAGLRAGATVTFLPRFDPRLVFKVLAGGVSVMPAVPTMYNQLLQYAATRDWIKPVAPGLRYISAGGAPLDLGWKRRVERFFNLPLQNGYGMTEATPIIAATRFGEHRNDVSVGSPPTGVELRIDTAGSKHSHSDGVGEVFCRGPNVMKGYYRDPVGTAKAIDSSGFLHTQDLGRFAEDGTLSLVGRARDIIIRSGFNVYPDEVETVINQHPSVVQSAVIGHQRADGNEDILAFIECDSNQPVTAARLNKFLKQHLAGYKRPAHIFVVEKIPAAPTGKLLKARIPEVFRELISQAICALDQERFDVD